MNVYSVRLIPNLKIKLCQFFGIATTLALEELGERLKRIDQKMDRFDAQLRRIHRRQMALEAAQVRNPLPEKKKQVKTARKKKRIAPSKKKPVAQGLRALPNSKPQKQPKDVNPLPLVLLIHADERTDGIVRDYFGQGFEIVTIKNIDEFPKGLEGRRLHAIFFERNLLSNPKARTVLQEIKEHIPQAHLVGLSSYLTLALAKATEAEEDFATFLTQPVSPEDLAKVFESPETRPAVKSNP
jgi:hypothetical protein